MDFILLFVLLLLGIACTMLAGHGRHQIAGVILPAGAWEIIARDSVFTGVVTAPSFAALISPILLAGLAVGLRLGLAPVYIDPTMINRVLEILLSNALLYIQDRGTITIHTEAVERTNQPGVAIIVSDNGPGISPEDQAHLFDRFYRGKSGRSGRPGVGVGLAIARELLHSSGGTLSVQSAGIAGRGTRITA